MSEGLTDAEMAALEAKGLTDEELQAKEPGAGAAFGRGAVKGATLGLSTPAAGGGAALASFLAHHLPSIMETLGYETRYPQELPQGGEAFREAAGHRAAEDEAARAAHPGAFMGGQVTGGLVPGMLVPGAGLGGQVASGAAQGAISGAADAAPTGELSDILGGAAQGAAFGGAGGALGTGLGKAAAGIANMGKRASSRALGMTLADLKAFAKQGETKLGNIEAVLGEAPDQLGIKAFGNPKTNTSRLLESVNAAGENVGKAVQAVEENAVPVSKAYISKSLEDQIADAAKRPGVSKSYVGALKREMASVLQGSEDQMSPAAIHGAMTELSPRAQGVYNNVLGPGDRAAASAAADTRKVLEKTLDKQAVAGGVGQQLEDANLLYGTLKAIATRARPRGVGEEMGNKTLGYTGSHLAGPIIGAAIGGGRSAGDPTERGIHALEGAALGLGARRGAQIIANSTALAAPVLARTLKAAGQAPIVNALGKSLGSYLGGPGEAKRNRILEKALSNPEDIITGSQ